MRKAVCAEIRRRRSKQVECQLKVATAKADGIKGDANFGLGDGGAKGRRSVDMPDETPQEDEEAEGKSKEYLQFHGSRSRTWSAALRQAQRPPEWGNDFTRIMNSKSQ